jgi:hypothetical protein
VASGIYKKPGYLCGFNLCEKSRRGSGVNKEQRAKVKTKLLFQSHFTPFLRNEMIKYKLLSSRKWAFQKNGNLCGFPLSGNSKSGIS